jgi:hypothetical protein
VSSDTLLGQLVAPFRSRLQPELLQIQVPLDPGQHVVADLAAVAQLDEGLALGLQRLALELLVRGEVLGGAFVLGPTQV